MIYDDDDDDYDYDYDYDYDDDDDDDDTRSKKPYDSLYNWDHDARYTMKNKVVCIIIIINIIIIK